MTFSALVLFFTLAASGAELNARGFKLYQQKKYDEALELFRKAAEASPDLALAHYNYAATLALLRKLEGPCQHDAYRSAIMESLERSIQLDPRRKKRALEDTDFESVHDTFRWQVLAGRSVDKNLAAVLVAVTWYGPSPGAYGPMSTIRFAADGTFDASALDLTGDEVKRVPSKGTWSVKGGKIVVKGGGKTSSGTLSKDGVLSIEGMDRYTDDPGECSA